MSSYGQLKRDAAIFVPVGLIVPWTTATAPSGFLLCAGQAVSRTDYAALFAVIGTTYGSGNGSTTFNIPDLAGKQVVFDDGNTTLAANAGAASATINTNINTDSANITSNVSGSTADFALTVNHLPAHKHKMFGNNTSRPSSLRITSHSNSNVAHEGSGGNAGYIMQKDPNNATPTAGNTSNAFNGNANGANHAHGAGNLAVTSTFGGTINATSSNVSSLLYTSLILNAIIKH
ncbi:MAG: putative tail fiber protein [Prokaryotic dsDNA virus sp.]|nr:MAG: putative tail fiber protein [Prokaryotic dsDNA virus sp.]|tara:strand:+ start:31050 stop:31748 length:699 start_codon:yes stop_codon:yes gene_type:complete